MTKRTEKQEEELEEQEVNSSGDGHSERLLLEQLRALNSRLDNMEGAIEETRNTNRANSEATLKLVNFIFNTDNEHMPELSFISPMAVESLVDSMTLDAMTDEDVITGKVSLNKKMIMLFLRFQRSVRGRLLLGIGKEALGEQLTTQGEQEASDEFEMGKEH